MHDHAMTFSTAERHLFEIVEASQIGTGAPTTLAALVRSISTMPKGALPDGTDLASFASEVLGKLEANAALVSTEFGFVLGVSNSILSRRRRVLSLAYRATLYYKRGVRSSEVWNYASIHAPSEVEGAALKPVLVTRDLQNLTTTGELIVLKKTRGNGGGNLLLPATFQNPEAWLPTAPLSWLDYVGDKIVELASELQSNHFAAKSLKSLLLADQVAGVSRAKARYNVDLACKTVVRSALESLSGGEAPLVAPMDGRRAVWTLLAMEEAQPSGEVTVFASDADRILEAARRKTRETSTVAFCAKEIHDAIEADPSLALSGRQSLSRVLSDLSRTTVPSSTGGRVPRRTIGISRVGKINGQAFYCLGEYNSASAIAAKSEVGFNRMKDAVRTSRISERIPLTNAAAPDLIALGRARTILGELDAFLPSLRNIGEEAWNSELGHELRDMYKQVESSVRFRARSTDSPSAPLIVQAGLTPMEVIAMYAPLCPSAAKLTSLPSVVAQYSRRLKRVPNPDFRSQRSPVPGTSTQYLFDRVSAYNYAAQNWGGTYSRLLIGWAAEDLGELRDARYVQRALETCPQRRTHLIAAMALLAPDNAVDIVMNYARNDTSTAVREAALWTAGLLLGESADPVLSEAENHDPDRGIRVTVRRWLSVGALWWWRV